MWFETATAAITTASNKLEWTRAQRLKPRPQAQKPRLVLEWCISRYPLHLILPQKGVNWVQPHEAFQVVLLFIHPQTIAIDAHFHLYTTMILAWECTTKCSEELCKKVKPFYCSTYLLHYVKLAVSIIRFQRATRKAKALTALMRSYSSQSLVRLIPLTIFSFLP